MGGLVGLYIKIITFTRQLFEFLPKASRFGRFDETCGLVGLERFGHRVEIEGMTIRVGILLPVFRVMIFWLLPICRRRSGGF